MRIITNGDDFGRCADTVKATIECLDAGVLTSASIMAKMPGTRLAVSYAKANPSFSFGVHLTFSGTTVEAPVLSPRNIPALVTHEGRFRQANRLRVMALSNQIPIEQIEAEAVAQISLLMEQGVPVSHVDSHFHLHKFPPFLEALRRALPKFGIRRVRNVQNVYNKRPLNSPTYWLGGVKRFSIARCFATTQHFFMDPIGEDSWPDDLLRAKRQGTLEIGVHPGYADMWRNQERSRIQRFTDNAVREGHELINWGAIDYCPGNTAQDICSS